MTYCGQALEIYDADILKCHEATNPKVSLTLGFFYNKSMLATYLISTNKNRPQLKVPFASKEYCLQNFLEVFKNERIFIFADNCDEETLDYLLSLDLEMHSGSYGYNHSQVQVYRKIKELNLPDDEIIYCSEDDYIHKDNAPELIKDGLNIADYVTLYDHPDKYSNLYRFGETVKIRRTFYSHWKNTLSTCMTFGFKNHTLKEDFDILTNLPNTGDHQLFLDLKSKGRYLYSSVPGGACQMDNFMNVNSANMTERWAIEKLIDEGLSHLSEQNLVEYNQISFDDTQFYQKLYWIDGALKSEEKDE